MFFKKNIKPLIPEWDRQWMEDAFRWLVREFPSTITTPPKVLLPMHFQFDSDSIEITARKILKVIAGNMMIDEKNIEFIFFEEDRKVYNAETGYPIFTIPENPINYNGMYYGKNEFEKYIIALNTSSFKYPNKIIATIAHELSHILLSEIKQIENYDEYLTDLLTVFYGIGIFNANAALNFYKDFYSSGYDKQGYLNEKEWAYALALFVSFRKIKTPEWINYLKSGIKNDVLVSLQYITNHLEGDWYLN